VTLIIEPEGELIPHRRESRARVVAAGLTDVDIDPMIKRAYLDQPGCCSRPKNPIASIHP
jgi:hypothetical protein